MENRVRSFVLLHNNSADAVKVSGSGSGTRPDLLTWREPTCRRQLVLHLQQNPLPHVLQQADDLLVPQLGQIDAVHRLDVVAHV